MANKRKLTVEITGDAKGAARAFRDTEKAGSSWGKKLGGFAKTAALGLAGVGVAAVGMGLSFVHAAEDSNKVTKQTAAVIKSTGNAAHVTAKQVADLSTALSLKSGVDDEVIQSGENVLLSFTNIRNEVGKGNDIFTQATGAALDMSVALGQDMQSSVIQLGKALNNPIQGMTALKRVGVTFSEDQVKVIKKLVETGDVLGAQKIILAELTKEFGGSAAAQATASDKLKVAFGNVEEELGNALLPLFTQFSDWMINVGVPWVQDHLVPAIRDDLVPAIKDIGKWISTDALPALQGATKWMNDHLIPVIKSVVSWLDRNETAFNAVKVAAVGAAVAAIAAWIGVSAPLALVIGLVAVGLILAFWNLKTVIDTVGDRWKGWIDRVYKMTLRLITGLQSLWYSLGVAVNQVARTIASAFKWAIGVARGAWDWLWSKVSAVVHAIAGAVDWVRDRIASLGRAISNLPGVGVIRSLVSNIPFLAEGGIVTSPTLAVVGESGPEAVVPLGDRRNIGGNTYVANHFHMEGAIVADERQFKRMVAKASNDLLAQGGLTVRGRRIQ